MRYIVIMDTRGLFLYFYPKIKVMFYQETPKFMDFWQSATFFFSNTCQMITNLFKFQMNSY